MNAVCEGAGARAAAQDAGTKKEVMVADAEQLVAGTGWLPSILRISRPVTHVVSADSDSLTIPPIPMAARVAIFSLASFFFGPSLTGRPERLVIKTVVKRSTFPVTNNRKRIKENLQD